MNRWPAGWWRQAWWRSDVVAHLIHARDQQVALPVDEERSFAPFARPSRRDAVEVEWAGEGDDPLAVAG